MANPILDKINENNANAAIEQMLSGTPVVGSKNITIIMADDRFYVPVNNFVYTIDDFCIKYSLEMKTFLKNDFDIVSLNDSDIKTICQDLMNKCEEDGDYMKIATAVFKSDFAWLLGMYLQQTNV